MRYEKITPYKIMTMKKLIFSAKEIIKNEGIDSVTIRKVGNLAGYNSATIYNYFESLEHLKIFACLFVVEDYIDDLKNYINDSKSLLDNYYLIWDCFIKHTINNYSVFFNIFFNNLEKNVGYYIEGYYSLFPVKNNNYGGMIDEMLESYSIESRNIILLKALSHEGYLDINDIEQINDLTSYSYEAILYRLYKGKISKEEAGNKIKKYVFEVIKKYLK